MFLQEVLKRVEKKASFSSGTWNESPWEHLELSEITEANSSKHTLTSCRGLMQIKQEEIGYVHNIYDYFASDSWYFFFNKLFKCERNLFLCSKQSLC